MTRSWGVAGALRFGLAGAVAGRQGRPIGPAVSRRESPRLPTRCLAGWAHLRRVRGAARGCSRLGRLG
eukprot:15267041-Alexandrium_andersonii.AAC.1